MDNQINKIYHGIYAEQAVILVQSNRLARMIGKTMPVKYIQSKYKINVKGVPCQHVATRISQSEDRQYATCLNCKEGWEE